LRYCLLVNRSSVVVYLFNFKYRCLPVQLQVSVLYCSASVFVMSRFSTLPPVKATVLVLHWIRFVSWLKAQVVVVCYVYIIT